MTDASHDESKRELLDKCIMALSGQYVNDEDNDTGKQCWNSAVGYCIGALRVIQEQLPAVPSATKHIVRHHRCAERCELAANAIEESLSTERGPK